MNEITGYLTHEQKLTELQAKRDLISADLRTVGDPTGQLRMSLATIDGEMSAIKALMTVSERTDERLAEACQSPFDCASSPYAQQSVWRCAGCTQVLKESEDG